jgi:hypothetical protein
MLLVFFYDLVIFQKGFVFLPRTNLSFLHSWDYRHKPPCPLDCGVIRQKRTHTHPYPHALSFPLYYVCLPEREQTLRGFAVCKPGRKSLPGTELATALIWDFQPPEL